MVERGPCPHSSHEVAMSDNLDIWNRLGRTDPAHTKGFKRAGGFSGTAIKPIYTDQKMTEVFGPCGDGWGYSEPTFQLVPAPDGQTAVYCWLSVWYRKADGTRSEPVHGVGGDFAVKKFSSGMVVDDEGFKKAFTDALGNAMKHLGMSADVHMGRFDDSKYVAELKREFAEQPAPPPDLRNVHDLHTNGKPIIRNASQETAGKMLTKLWTIQGDAVAVWLQRDDVKRALASLDEVDRHRVEDMAEERNALGNLEAAQ
ncbi:hypothetical protein MKK88_30945 [Methylobacterium sp. E-005]|uniref:hypothetical protein n=1 Tax=Methylobacterium sp. E-005 TaxID=2836549 RepID=UPI001FB8789E|nr:hypothetical protein [Methylobacterium sp. E-005]MCJ2090369.1 hypothetical protein [Methylobacterium sp. E-005]